ncbi:MAG: EAL domain-containing protein [Anaerolineaceae bacterium]|nr:EAL domain-containing protein [Anaerolineaceae bacterium]
MNEPPFNQLEIPHQENILIVDDNPANLNILSQILEQEGYTIRAVRNGTMVMNSIKAEPPDLILLDIIMPEINGFEVCKQIKLDQNTADIPIIFISALDDLTNKVYAFQVGGLDYITKPFQVEEVLARVRTHLSLKKLQNELKNWNETLEKRVAERTSELEKSQSILKHLAYYDMLTGFPNHNFFREKLQTLLVAPADPKNFIGITVIKLENFSTMNETLGRPAGEMILKQVAERLSELFKEKDLLAKLGDDTFAAIFTDNNHTDDILQKAQRIHDISSHFFQANEIEVFINLVIGISVFPEDGIDVDTLLKNAESALVFAKSEVGNSITRYQADISNKSFRKLELINHLRLAIQRDELVLHYQPQVNLTNGEIVGFEALIRWEHPDLGLISPNHFIPLAEESGSIHAIGNWVLSESCRMLADLKSRSKNNLQVAVNVSSIQLADGNFARGVQQIIKENNISPEDLIIEITESVFVRKYQAAIPQLFQLQDLGISIHVDDFGTGYSSLAYLGNLPLNTIKIDRSFINNLTQTKGSDINRATVVKAIITLAHGHNMEVVAEGVETPRQLEILQALGCEFAQGYLFSRPVPGADLIKTISAFKNNSNFNKYFPQITKKAS